MFYRLPSYLLLCITVTAAALTLAGCDPNNDEGPYKDPYPFPALTEDSTGSRINAITYVYEHAGQTDSSVIQFSYVSPGKVNRIRLTQGGNYVYDISFERSNNKLTDMHCKSWVIRPNPKVDLADFELEYNGSGNVSLMRNIIHGFPYEIDTFIVKSTGNRIDTIIDRAGSPVNPDKYAYTYNGSGDITQIDHIGSSGVFWVFVEVFKYTLSANPAPLVLGNEAIFWNFFIHYVEVSSNTEFLTPPILFYSGKQPSKMDIQVTGLYTGTCNYQTQYYPSGRPKKMTANVITPTGAIYAREAFYYSYAQ